MMRKPITILFFIFSSILYSHAQTITTVAGNGTAGYNSDNIQATAAEINRPSGVAVDRARNLYISDASNNRIRKVDAATGIITTFAGTGISGFNVGSGAATAVQLNNPQGLAMDNNGNLYIADVQNNLIRKVSTTTGLMTTVAGGGIDSGGNGQGDGRLATAAVLVYPTGVAVDSIGNIYIACSGEYRIRKVTASTGIITTVVGTGVWGQTGDGGLATAATLSTPTGVALDRRGNLYLVDQLSGSVRKVDSAGIISRLPVALYSPYAVTVDGDGNLYIADSGNDRILKVAAGSGIVTTAAGDSIAGYSGDGGPAPAAALYQPEGVGADSAGNLYIADTYNNRVRKVNLACAGAYFTVQPSQTPHLYYLLDQSSGRGLSYSWTWGDNSAADTGATPSHTYANSGNYTICLTVTDISGCANSYCDSNASVYKTQSGQMVQVNVVDRIPNGISDLSDNQVGVYPNPNSGIFTLETSGQIGETYLICDMLGQIIQEKVITSDKQHIDMSANAAGVYSLLLGGRSGAVRLVR